MNLESDIELLAQVPMFEGLTADQMRLLAFSLIRTDLDAGAVLFHQGDKASSGYIVSFGAIELTTGEGETRKLMELCHRGYLIGELALFMPSRRPVTATAANVCSVVELSRPLFLRMLNEYPKVAALLRTRLAERLRGTVAELQRVRRTLLAMESGR